MKKGENSQIFVSLFGVPKEKTKEEKEEEIKKNNPFLNRNEKSIIHPKNGSKKLSLVMDSMTEPVEKYYFFFTKFLSVHESSSFGIHTVSKDKQPGLIKLKDVFDASVSSAFHGNVGSKISAIQQQVSSYLTQIGQLTKTIFPMVREIRMMDERREYYNKSLSANKDDPEARQNEITLKSMWVEIVEQGMQNPNSVYSLATKLGFVTLPDLFFGINPHGKTIDEQQKNLTKVMDAMQKEHQFTQKLRDILTKKLVQYYTWKLKTHSEMEHTWKFRIKNLKQHYNVIRLYVSWLKPLMTSLKALQMKTNIYESSLVSSFESSKLELELLGVTKRGKYYNSCVLIRITQVTRPELTYTQGGQKQVQHSGEVKIEIEPYVATDFDIDYYKEECDKDILKTVYGQNIDFSVDVEEVLKSLGSDVEKYLEEAEQGKKENKEEEKKKEIVGQSLFEPFTSLAGAYKMFFPFLNKEEKKEREIGFDKEEEKKELTKKASDHAWLVYDVFKKMNGLMTP
ncbi:hypothetical protein J4223_02105 [Candidatus Woesearchaeota archaeon]|nr:hypothetical protein [Candidatus Woesearchaeota archaeon]